MGTCKKWGVQEMGCARDGDVQGIECARDGGIQGMGCARDWDKADPGAPLGLQFPVNGGVLEPPPILSLLAPMGAPPGVFVHTRVSSHELSVPRGQSAPIPPGLKAQQGFGVVLGRFGVVLGRFGVFLGVFFISVAPALSGGQAAALHPPHGARGHGGAPEVRGGGHGVPQTPTPNRDPRDGAGPGAPPLPFALTAQRVPEPFCPSARSVAALRGAGLEEGVKARMRKWPLLSTRRPQP